MLSHGLYSRIMATSLLNWTVLPLGKGADSQLVIVSQGVLEKLNVI